MLPLDHRGSAGASAFSRALAHYVRVLPRGWVRREPGALAAVTGVAVANLNGVWVDELDADAGDVDSLLGEVAGTSVPYCLQLRPGSSPALAGLPTERGMAPAAEIPLMVLDRAGDCADQAGTGLRIRAIMPEQASLHARVAAGAFAAPESFFEELVTPAVLGASGICCYLGEVDDEPVATGLGMTLGDSVGVFNVATLPEHRGRGYGTAITARVVRDGAALGARWAWLQSSSDGQGIYERLGFQSVELWQCWVSGG